MFSDDQNSERPIVLNLHDNINSTVQLLNSRIKSHITIHKQYGEIQLINGWPGKLNQAFTSLICNSIEAINESEKGNIYITTYQEEDFVNLLFEDDGEGVADVIKDKIFEPFFSTKNGYNGLGLPIVKTIIDSHKGQIMLSKHGAKTRIHITIPVSLDLE